MITFYIILCVLLVLNIVFDVFDYILFKKYIKRTDEKVENLSLAVTELSKKVIEVQNSKEKFDKTTETISKEHRFLINEINKTNEAITIMNNGFTVAGAKNDNIWDTFNKVMK